VKWMISYLVFLVGCASAPGVVANESETKPEKPNAAPSDASKDEAVAKKSNVKKDQSSPVEPRILRFSWRPPGGPAVSYQMLDSEDQHRIVIYPGIKPEASYPVVIGFHGQPKRGKDPRNYKFLQNVPKIVDELAASGKFRPFIFVLPVFRFEGQNWPVFDMRGFRSKVEKILAAKGIGVEAVLVFGHSGAAGCGGDGLNTAHKMSPAAVGFFDTCLGKGWQGQIRMLKKNRIPTVNIHSVETAGFRPRHRPEYDSNFDFGRAYGPLEIEPIACPKRTPGARLRNQKYRCAATADGIVRGFVVDSGEGAEAHEALLPLAISYFFEEFVGPASSK
jgi:hypothetical protein